MGTQVFDNSPVEGGYHLFTPSNLIQSIRRNNSSKFRAVRLGLVVADTVMITLVFWLSYNLRFVYSTAELFDDRAFAASVFYSQTVFFLIPIWLVIFAWFRLYDPTMLFGGYQEYTNAFNAITVGMMLLVLATFFDPLLLVARAWLVIAWVLLIVLIITERFAVRRVIYWLRMRGHFTAPAYIVGANSEGVAIAEQLMSAPLAGVNIIGFLDDTIPAGEEVLPGVVVHGTTDRAHYLVNRFGIERLIVATSGVQRDKMLELFRSYVNSEQVSVWLSSGLYEILTTGVQVQDVGSVPMVSVNRVRLTGPNIVAKFILDYVGATLGLIALSPIFLGIAIWMKMTDPGPIVYRRRVVGVGGKEFDAFKFRTMVVNSNEVLQDLLERDPEARAEWEQFYKLKNDPRITRVGNLLRKTSIDELPQLFNVLRGEMSLVGPRMITVEEVQRYGKWGLNLHTVKPGITGLWQVTGRSELTYEERVRLDMRYIRNYSIWMDIQILVMTVPAVLMSKGAY